MARFTIHRDQILRRLQAFNPWWSSGTLFTEPFERVALRMCLQRLADTTLHRAIMLNGPRRVGKTTLLKQVVKRLLADGVEPYRIVFLTLDDNVIKLATLESTLDTYRDLIHTPTPSSPAFLLIDEVQYAPDWDRQVKLLVDHHPEYRIIATGSASMRASQDTIDAGVGRFVTIAMPTLSFYEFLHIRQQAPTVDPSLRLSDLASLATRDQLSLVQTMRPTISEFMRYMLVGGFPETAKRSDITEAQRLIREDIVDRVIKRDMVALFKIRNISELERLFLYICMNTGGLLNVSSCASDLGLQRQTVTNHLDILVQANLLYQLRHISPTGKKALKTRDKYYIVDAGLRNAVQLNQQEIFSDATEMGLILETTVLRHFIAYYYADHPLVGYWRDARNEVDIVIQGGRYTIPVEVKRDTSGHGDNFRGLLAFAQAFPQATSGFLVTDVTGDIASRSLQQLHITQVPGHIAAYLLGQSERR